MTKNLLDAYNPDTIEKEAQDLIDKIPEDKRTPAKEEEVEGRLRVI